MRAAPMVDPSRPMTVDIVLRERDAIAALPNVVRSIRQFAEPPLLNRLNHAMKSLVSGAQMDKIVAQHNKDLRLDALKEQTSQQKPLPWTHTALVGRIARYAVQHCSVRAVEWAIDTSRSIRVQSLVDIAIKHNRLVVVQLLYPRLKAGTIYPFQEINFFNYAAALAHEDMAILDWMLANRICQSTMCNETALNFAAQRGHLHVLKWIYAARGNQLHGCVLKLAALHGQQHVLDWIYEERAASFVWLAMQCVAKKRDFKTLAWLHDKYPTDRLFLRTLQKLVRERMQLDVVVWLVRHYPEQYAHDGVVMGAFCGDLEAAKNLAARRFATRKEVKNAMIMAAKHGHLTVLQWLSHYFGVYYVPIRTLWRALCRGHLNVVCWIMEQTPELITTERLVRMHATCVRQPKKNVDPRGDIKELTRWIEAQQLRIIERESQI